MLNGIGRLLSQTEFFNPKYFVQPESIRSGSSHPSAEVADNIPELTVQ